MPRSLNSSMSKSRRPKTHWSTAKSNKSAVSTVGHKSDGLLAQMKIALNQQTLDRSLYTCANNSTMKNMRRHSGSNSKFVILKVTRFHVANGSTIIKTLVKPTDLPGDDSGTFAAPNLDLRLVFKTTQAENMNLAINSCIKIVAPWQTFESSGITYLLNVFWVDPKIESAGGSEEMEEPQKGQQIWDCPCRITQERLNPIPASKCRPTL